jgi:hypothetical protein
MERASKLRGKRGRLTATRAPLPTRYLIVSTEARIRVSSVIFLPSRGTLRSQRIRTCEPRRKEHGERYQSPCKAPRAESEPALRVHCQALLVQRENSLKIPRISSFKKVTRFFQSPLPHKGGKRARVPRAQPSLIAAPEGVLCTSRYAARGEPTFLPLSSVSLRSLTDFLAIMVIAGVALPLRRVGMVAARVVEAVRREGVKEEARATWVFCGEKARASEHVR